MCGVVEIEVPSYPDAIVPGSRINALRNEIEQRMFAGKRSLLESERLEDMLEARALYKQCNADAEAAIAALYAAVSDAEIQSYVDRTISELQFLADRVNTLLETLPAAGSLDDARALTDLHRAWEPYQGLRDAYLREMELVGDRFEAPNAPYVGLTVEVIMRLDKWYTDRNMIFRV